MSLVSRPNLVAMIVASAFFMQTLDGNIVGTALPQIARSFGIGPERISIAITAYLLSLAVFIPISGWVADRFGSRPIFQIAIGLFTLGSLLCGVSQNLPEFVGARVLQGLGGALVVPIGRSVVLRAVSKSEMVKALAFLSVPAQIGPAIGPPLGGLITTYASWRWVFLINLPVGILGMVLTRIYMENHREPERFPLDWVGFLYSSIALCSLLYALDALGRGNANWFMVAGSMLVGILAGVATVRHSRRHPHPLIDLTLIRLPTFSVNFWAGTWFRAGVGTLSFLLPLLYQTVFGMSAFSSGMITFISAIGATGMRASAARFLKLYGFRNVLVVAGLLSSASVMVCGFFSPSWPVGLMIGLLFIGGLVQALHLFSLNSIAYAEIAGPQMSAATSLAQLLQQLGKTSGVAIAALLLQLSLAWRGATSLSTTDFLVAFIGVGLISLIGMPQYAKLDPAVGADITGYVPKVRHRAGNEEPRPGE